MKTLETHSTEAMGKTGLFSIAQVRARHNITHGLYFYLFIIYLFIYLFIFYFLFFFKSNFVLSSSYAHDEGFDGLVSSS